MAAGILSQPVLEEASTSIEPDFDSREYTNWVSTYRDIPEHIIEHLAANRQRNEFIASYYVAEKDRFGKTIIFADRWYQCDQIREALRIRGVRADVVYSHIDVDPGNAEARNRRATDENSTVLKQFRNGELDVLVNVRMLTEGTDVPDIQTVFLTRQTTSQILLTQNLFKCEKCGKSWDRHCNAIAQGQPNTQRRDGTAPVGRWINESEWKGKAKYRTVNGVRDVAILSTREVHGQLKFRLAFIVNTQRGRAVPPDKSEGFEVLRQNDKLSDVEVCR